MIKLVYSKYQSIDWKETIYVGIDSLWLDILNYSEVKITYPTYERGDIIPSRQLRGICTYAMIVPTVIELLLNTLHYID